MSTLNSDDVPTPGEALGLVPVNSEAGALLRDLRIAIEYVPIDSVKAYAIELDPHFVDVGVMRWQRWSGQKARHAETGLTLEELRAERSRSAPDTQAAIAPPPAVRHRTRAR
jgi:hypothetical protein